MRNLLILGIAVSLVAVPTAVVPTAVSSVTISQEASASKKKKKKKKKRCVSVGVVLKGLRGMSCASAKEMKQALISYGGRYHRNGWNCGGYYDSGSCRNSDGRSFYW